MHFNIKQVKRTSKDRSNKDLTWQNIAQKTNFLSGKNQVRTCKKGFCSTQFLQYSLAYTTDKTLKTSI